MDKDEFNKNFDTASYSVDIYPGLSSSQVLNSKIEFKDLPVVLFPLASLHSLHNRIIRPYSNSQLNHPNTVRSCLAFQTENISPGSF